jgi:hypothetical protein
MKTNFSKKELDMIEILSPNWYDLIKNKRIEITSEPSILEIIGMDCFLENKSGPAVDSIRRCLIALKKSNPYRLTEEYENLITI